MVHVEVRIELKAEKNPRACVGLSFLLSSQLSSFSDKLFLF